MDDCIILTFPFSVCIYVYCVSRWPKRNKSLSSAIDSFSDAQSSRLRIGMSCSN